MTVEIHILRFVSASLQDTYTSYSMPEVFSFLTSYWLPMPNTSCFDNTIVLCRVEDNDRTIMDMTKENLGCQVNNENDKNMLENTHGVIKKRQSRETGNIRYTRHRTDTC
jgi:hypothetical protein